MCCFTLFLCKLKKAFLSLLAILWNSAFRCLYLSFSPLLFASLLFSAICKAKYFIFMLLSMTHFFKCHSLLPYCWCVETQLIFVCMLALCSVTVQHLIIKYFVGFFGLSRNTMMSSANEFYLFLYNSFAFFSSWFVTNRRPSIGWLIV